MEQQLTEQAPRQPDLSSRDEEGTSEQRQFGAFSGGSVFAASAGSLSDDEGNDGTNSPQRHSRPDMPPSSEQQEQHQQPAGESNSVQELLGLLLAPSFSGTTVGMLSPVGRPDSNMLLQQLTETASVRSNANASRAQQEPGDRPASGGPNAGLSSKQPPADDPPLLANIDSDLLPDIHGLLATLNSPRSRPYGVGLVPPDIIRAQLAANAANAAFRRSGSGRGNRPPIGGSDGGDRSSNPDAAAVPTMQPPPPRPPSTVAAAAQESHTPPQLPSAAAAATPPDASLQQQQQLSAAAPSPIHDRQFRQPQQPFPQPPQSQQQQQPQPPRSPLLQPQQPPRSPLLHSQPPPLLQLPPFPQPLQPLHQQQAAAGMQALPPQAQLHPRSATPPPGLCMGGGGNGGGGALHMQQQPPLVHARAATPPPLAASASFPGPAGSNGTADVRLEGCVSFTGNNDDLFAAMAGTSATGLQQRGSFRGGAHDGGRSSSSGVAGFPGEVAMATVIAGRAAGSDALTHGTVLRPLQAPPSPPPPQLVAQFSQPQGLPGHWAAAQLPPQMRISSTQLATPPPSPPTAAVISQLPIPPLQQQLQRTADEDYGGAAFPQLYPLATGGAGGATPNRTSLSGAHPADAPASPYTFAAGGGADGSLAASQLPNGMGAPPPTAFAADYYRPFDGGMASYGREVPAAAVVSAPASSNDGSSGFRGCDGSTGGARRTSYGGSGGGGGGGGGGFSGATLGASGGGAGGGAAGCGSQHKRARGPHPRSRSGTPPRLRASDDDDDGGSSGDDGDGGGGRGGGGGAARCFRPEDLPEPVAVTVTGLGREVGEDGRRRRITVHGVFHPDRYLANQDCILYNNQFVSRSRFEKEGGSTTAKWHCSIKVAGANMVALGHWLTSRGLPVLKGGARKSKRQKAAEVTRAPSAPSASPPHTRPRPSLASLGAAASAPPATTTATAGGGGGGGAGPSSALPAACGGGGGGGAHSGGRSAAISTWPPQQAPQQLGIHGPPQQQQQQVPLSHPPHPQSHSQRERAGAALEAARGAAAEPCGPWQHMQPQQQQQKMHTSAQQQQQHHHQQQHHQQQLFMQQQHQQQQQRAEAAAAAAERGAAGLPPSLPLLPHMHRAPHHHHHPQHYHHPEPQQQQPQQPQQQHPLARSGSGGGPMLAAPGLGMRNAAAPASGPAMPSGFALQPQHQQQQLRPMPPQGPASGASSGFLTQSPFHASALQLSPQPGPPAGVGLRTSGASGNPLGEGHHPAMLRVDVPTMSSAPAALGAPPSSPGLQALQPPPRMASYPHGDPHLHQQQQQQQQQQHHMRLPAAPGVVYGGGPYTTTAASAAAAAAGEYQRRLSSGGGGGGEGGMGGAYRSTSGNLPDYRTSSGGGGAVELPYRDARMAAAMAAAGEAPHGVRPQCPLPPMPPPPPSS
ncbi:hypothetical protein Agub_g8757 [Astrephomene gubernaculifera]|uniref:Uncharacterized protein n=1 Tax=Astrephomene gubernaculifera TaxID=47775 RepID=A0AAD3DS60_9CHLO|nr:hypothetical protein Agub_g8757 [Astrephomene gubernaculifera]